MALIHIKTDGTENGQTAADKINLGFDQTDLNAADLDIHSGYINTNITNINTHDNEITSLQSDVATLQNTAVPSLVSIMSPSKGSQLLEPGVAEKLVWGDNEVVNHGVDIGWSEGGQEFTIFTDGIYKVFGVITLDAGINDIIDIELYVDNLPTGFITSAIGRGNNSKVSYPSTFLTHFNANDEIALYITSTGESIRLSSASMTVEKTQY